MIGQSAAMLSLAQVATTQPGNSATGLASWVAILAIMAVAPFVLTMVTSFAKLVIVGGILRHALGTQQIPPNTVITGLALILTVHIMYPVAAKVYDACVESNATVDAAKEDLGPKSLRIANAAEKPIREFLTRHSHQQNRALFKRLREKLLIANGVREDHALLDEKSPWHMVIHDATILAPAFILTELEQAFQIGFLIFVPFLVIDLVVSNVLLAMGMQMLSPTTVSMPLKLLLFVLIDGWTIILRGLVLGYT